MRNFLSYGNVPTIVQLNRSGTTLILGENLDDTSSGTRSNGVGKSVIINAICYAAYDKTISPVSKDGLVNNINKKNMEVTLSFSRGTDEYMIKRTRKTKAGAAGNTVHFYENGKEVTPDSVKNMNKKIEEEIGIPYELFVRIVTFSATHTPFLDLPVRSHYAANQTDIIESLFSLTQLSEQATQLKAHRDETGTKLSALLKSTEQLKREHKRHSVQLESAHKRVSDWTKTNKAELQAVNRKIKRLGEIDVEEQRTLNDNLIDIAHELQTATDGQQKATAEIKSAKKERVDANKELKHLRDDKCPYCKQQFADTKKKIASNEKILKSVEKRIELAETKSLQWEEDVAKHAHEHKLIKTQITSDIAELTELEGKGVL